MGFNSGFKGLTETPVTNRSEYFLALIYGTATHFITAFWTRSQKCEERLLDSNKSTNSMHQSLGFIARRSNTPQHVSGILLSIIRSL